MESSHFGTKSSWIWKFELKTCWKLKFEPRFEHENRNKTEEGCWQFPSSWNWRSLALATCIISVDFFCLELHYTNWKNISTPNRLHYNDTHSLLYRVLGTHPPHTKRILALDLWQTIIIACWEAQSKKIFLAGSKRFMSSFPAPASQVSDYGEGVFVFLVYW